MKCVSLDQLVPIASVRRSLLHPSGEVLFEKGARLTDAMIQVLEEAGLKEVFRVETHETLKAAQRQLTHQACKVRDLNAGDDLGSALYDDDGRLLVEEGIALSSGFLRGMVRRGVEVVYRRRSAEELGVQAGQSLRGILRRMAQEDRARARGEIGEETAGADGAKPGCGACETCALEPEMLAELKRIAVPEASPEDFKVSALNQKINRMGALDVPRSSTTSVKKRVRDTRRLVITDREKEAFSYTVQVCLRNMDEILKALARTARESAGQLFAMSDIDRIVENLMAGVVHHRELMMLIRTEAPKSDYLPRHALATATIAAAVGTEMEYSAGQVKALTTGALLADVGMVRVARSTIDKTSRLTAGQEEEIRLHPTYGLALLANIIGLPEEVPYIVYQSHERCDGSGYPCHRRDANIHPFAKVVAVADTFVALCSPRPYRPAFSPYKAVEEILHMASRRELNAKVVRAFLRCNSLFPVGSFVELSDGRAARVVAPNEEDFTKPVVAVEDPAAPGSYTRLDLRETPAIRVERALDDRLVGNAADQLVGF